MNASYFAPQGALPSDGSGSGLPAAVTVIEGPTSNGNLSRQLVGANSIQASLTGAITYDGMYVMSWPMGVDPQQSSANLRGTAGALVDDVTYTNRQANDARAFLYGHNATDNVAERVRVNTGGQLLVASGVASTVTTVGDQATNTASATSIAAANANRQQIIVQNLDTTNAVRVGDSAVTATRGIRVPAGGSVTLAVTAQIYAIAEAGTPSVAVTQIVT